MIAVYLAMLETDVDRDKFMKLFLILRKETVCCCITYTGKQ